MLTDFQNSFTDRLSSPPIDSLPASGLTPRTSRLGRFFWASPLYVFSFFVILFFVWFPCGRLSWLHVSFWAHVNIVHHIISYHKFLLTKLLNIPSHLKRVDTLPCEIVVFENRNDPKLCEENCHSRLSHSKHLLKNIYPVTLASFLFTDEKIFIVAAPNSP